MNIYSHGGKKARQAALLQAIREEELGTQEDAVRALKKRGIKATQVSVSRDISELGLVKAGGRYQAAAAQPQAADLEYPIQAWVRSARAAGPYMTVIRCATGTAQRVGLALDQLAMSEVVGTLAGDDTVFCATTTPADNERLLRFLRCRIPAGAAA